ncbi:hypothetical protein WKU49_22400, partial [Salmonella enterica]
YLQQCHLSQHVHLKPTDYRASFRSLVG